MLKENITCFGDIYTIYYKLLSNGVRGQLDNQSPKQESKPKTSIKHILLTGALHLSIISCICINMQGCH